MSENSERHLTVRVERDKEEIERMKKELEEAKQKREEYKELLDAVAQEAFRQEIHKLKEQYPHYANRLNTITSPDELEIIKEFLSVEAPRKPSTGTVKLLPPTNKNDIWTREFEDPEKFVKAIYDAYRNAEDPAEKRRLKGAIRKLLQIRTDWSTFPKTMEIPVGLEGECARDLGKRNFDFREYKQWLQEKREEERQNART